MKRKWLWLGLALTVVVAAPFAILGVLSYRDRAAFEEQIWLARAEGIPTDWKEFTALVPAAKPEENAAPYYREIKGIWSLLTNAGEAEKDLFTKPGAGSIAKAKAQLALNAPLLQKADKAAELPKCWFDRDWSKGMALLMPELATMKGAARLFALRGSLYAVEGKPEAAVAEAHKIFIVADQAGQEPHYLSASIQSSIYGIGLTSLAEWAASYPEVPQYKEVLRSAVKDIPELDVRQEHLTDLLNVLSIIELSATKEGRDELGLRDEDVSNLEGIAGVFISRPQSRIELVKALRRYWAALDKTPLSESELDESTQQMYRALLAFPTAAGLVQAMGFHETNPVWRVKEWEARNIRFAALARALVGSSVARKIKTSDLISPFDGKPVIYNFDGKRILIETGGAGTEPARLVVDVKR